MSDERVWCKFCGSHNVIKYGKKDQSFADANTQYMIHGRNINLPLAI
ncbi:MAG: hypothetical protein H3Z53_02530 [archaeon]|nr:hypothetical protein [archaeon]MCP8313236.1 hypothetical protein [archaeon]MCP8319791.1 hypothetical protein [archaeon]